MTTLTSLLAVDDLVLAANIGIVATVAKFGLSYGYELVWDGRIAP